jgi:hypothetical protein
MSLDEMFLKFIQVTKPKFGVFIGANKCIYLNGGMAVRLLTREYRRSIGKKLPSKDYDFTWAKSTKPTRSDYDLMCRFTAKLGRDFAKTIGGTAVIKKQYFPEPKVQNIVKQRLLFAHVAVNIIINGKEEDLMDAILLQSPGASSEILNKTMSIKYGLPLPKMGTLFIDTATVVKKSLVGEGYNAWRNPIQSTHPKHPANYQKKGLKNINRLLLMGQILSKEAKYKSVLNDIKLLNSTIKRTSLGVKAKLALGKTIGESMNTRIKNINR